MKPINELFKLNDVWLDEIYDRLWYEYYTPFAPLNKETKNFIREQLNFVAVEHNKVLGDDNPLGKLTIVKAADTWEDDGNGPLLVKTIYVDIKKPGVKKPVVDEDLLGLNKKAIRKTAVVETEKKLNLPVKGKYDTIAKLAAQGKNKDEIQAATGFERKTVTDLLWRYNKLKK